MTSQMTGAFVVWDADSGAELVRAVASSLRGSGPVRTDYHPEPALYRRRLPIGNQRRFGQGPWTRPDCVAPEHARTTGAIDPRMLPPAQLDEEVAILRGGGAESDDAGARAMGANLMNPWVAPIGLEEGPAG